MARITVAAAIGVGAAGLIGAAAFVMTSSSASTSAVTAAADAPTRVHRAWRLSHADSGNEQSGLGGIAAVSPRDVWAVGSAWHGYASSRAVAEHWDGKRWTNTALPAEFVKPVSPPQASLRYVGASSSTNVWAIGDAGNNTYTLRWDGHRWTVQHNWKYNRLSRLVVIGPKDVWAIDYITAGQGVWHYNGTSWKWVSTPLYLTDAQALSPNDIWAVGGTNEAGVKPTVAHWNGHNWRVVPTPNIPWDNGGPWPAFSSISVASARDIWAVGKRSVPDGQSYGDRPFALHWDGYTWQRIDPTGTRRLISAIPDGQGGVWVSEDYNDLLHFTAGRWTRVTLPHATNTDIRDITLSRAPNTTSLWAGGTINGPYPKPAGIAPEHIAILTYVP